MPRLCRNAMDDVATRQAKDYVIASGQQHSVKISLYVNEIGIELSFQGEGE